MHVLALEVVPAALGRLDAVADEHQLGASIDMALSPLVGDADGDLLALGQRRRLAGDIHR